MAGDSTLAQPMRKSGIVFFAHGSRDPLWRKPIEAVAQLLQHQHPNALSCCAYLELDTPDLHTACQSLIAQGCGAITVLPMFLGTGRHAREDLPLLVAQLRHTFPHIPFEMATAVGEDPRVTQLLATLAAEYIA